LVRVLGVLPTGAIGFDKALRSRSKGDRLRGLDAGSGFRLALAWIGSAPLRRTLRASLAFSRDLFKAYIAQ
jgi:hypothetical protein